jgi:hypothetical protein
MSTQRLLTTGQTAERMGITVQDLAVPRENGKGPDWGRFGGAIRYDVRDVDEWIKARDLANECPDCQAGPGQECHLGCSSHWK